MAKNSRQQKRILAYNDTPLKPDFSKSGEAFVQDLMKQLPLPIEQDKPKN